MTPDEILHVCAWCEPQTTAGNVSHGICNSHKAQFLKDAHKIVQKNNRRVSNHTRRHKHAIQKAKAWFAAMQQKATDIFPLFQTHYQLPDASHINLADSAFFAAARESWRESLPKTRMNG